MERGCQSASGGAQRDHLPHLVRGRGGGRRLGRRVRRRGPERLHARVDRGPLRRPAARDRPGRDGARAPDPDHRPRRPARDAARRHRPARARRGASAAHRGPAQLEVHLRLVRHRLVEPVRARGRARGRGGAGPGVQPALHLRGHRARQDAPDAGDRAVRRRAHRSADRALRHERDVHERLHQLAARQADRGLQAPIPQLRPAPRRRHPVLRGQGADPGGVLPHLQLALRDRGRRSSSRATGRRATSPRSRSACGRGSSGG